MAKEEVEEYTSPINGETINEQIEDKVYYDCDYHHNQGVIELTEAESAANRKLLKAILKTLTEEQLKEVLNNV